MKPSEGKREKMNEPAFPQAKLSACTNPDCKYVREIVGQFQGMTLRDYFAAKAMQAVITKYGREYLLDDSIGPWSYNVADQMIEERSK